MKYLLLSILLKQAFLRIYIKIDLYLVKLIEHSIIIEIINKHGYSKKFSTQIV